MKKLIMLIGLTVLLIGAGFIGAINLGLIEADFTDKVLTISTRGICGAESLSATRLCDKDTPDEIDVSDSRVSFIKDPKTGVIKVSS